MNVAYVSIFVLCIIIQNVSPFSSYESFIEDAPAYGDTKEANKHAKPLHPVILIPGDGGSQILAKINKTQVVHYICAKKTDDWFYLWLDPTQILPLIIDCWVDNMRLIYDNNTRTTRNNDGVVMKIPDFGNTTSVEYLDVGRSSYALYFGNIVDALVDMGYERKRSIFAAPYDFRKAANEQDDWFKVFKQLVESSYKNNNNMPVILLSHSMGSPMMLYFLSHYVDQAWKDKYIRCQISMSGVLGGTVRATKVFALGDNLGSYLVQSFHFRTEQRASPSLAWLMPSTDLWEEDEVLIQSQNINITLSNYREFYDLLGQPDGYEMYKDTKDLLKGIPAPQIEFYCWHGIGVPTTEKLIYYKFPTSTPIVKKGDGDGTVNLRSMKACLKWRTQQSKPVHYRAFKHIDHGNMIKADEPVSGVADLIDEINTKTRFERKQNKNDELSNTSEYDEPNLNIKNNDQHLCARAKNKELCLKNEHIPIPSVKVIR